MQPFAIKSFFTCKLQIATKTILKDGNKSRNDQHLGQLAFYIALAVFGPLIFHCSEAFLDSNISHRQMNKGNGIFKNIIDESRLSAIDSLFERDSYLGNPVG